MADTPTTASTPGLNSTLSELVACMGDLKAALTTPRLEPLLLDREQLAEALGGISTDTLDRLAAAGKLPPPVSLGRRKLWSKAEIAAWIAAGTPDCARWMAMKRT